MKVWKLYNKTVGGSPCVFTSQVEAEDFKRMDMEAGVDDPDEMVIVEGEMTQEQFDKLAEFQGW